MAADNEVTDFKMFITEDEKCRVFFMNFNGNHLEKIVVCFTGPVSESGMEFPTQNSAGGITMEAMDKTIGLYFVKFY